MSKESNRKKDTYNNTTDSRVYKMIRRRYTLGCDRCPPNRKENGKRNHPARSWKSYRKTKYIA